MGKGPIPADAVKTAHDSGKLGNGTSEDLYCRVCKQMQFGRAGSGRDIIKADVNCAF